MKALPWEHFIASTYAHVPLLEQGTHILGETGAELISWLPFSSLFSAKLRQPSAFQTGAKRGGRTGGTLTHHVVSIGWW